MGSSAYSALSGAVLSADLCARYASAVGLSLFLLVSVRLGDPDLRAAGRRVHQAENLIELLQGDGLIPFMLLGV